jgi:hypothetical protein
VLVVGKYEQYGISRDLVERLKLKIKEPSIKEQVKWMLNNVTKADLQDRTKVRKLISRTAKLTGETIRNREADRIADFIITQKIDPQNMFHLFRLWSMFHG